MKASPSLYTIPARFSFADSLAKGLLELEKDTPEKLSSYLILLPTRRGCRVVQDAFLRCTQGKPILLPRLQPIGDIDEDELNLSIQTDQILDIPPAISPLKRSIILAQIISKIPNFSKNPAQDIALAKSLGQLLDQIYTENLDIKKLPELVDRELFANHWQITLDFLNILTEHWPQILEEQGVIDASLRRTKLINALNDHWQNTEPNHTVIAAGSTGSIPSTRTLLKTISQLDKGSVILPGLDQEMNEYAWNAIEETHPQNTLKELIDFIGIERDAIKNWDAKSDQKNHKEKIISQIMLPASETKKWQHLEKDNSDNISSDLHYLTCDTTQKEASLISILLRETLEEEGKTAALITSDRDLAKRVKSICSRWNIYLDDSAGTTLSQTKIGSFIQLSALTCIENLSPGTLLSFLKHDLCRPQDFKNFRKAVRLLDKEILRGLKPDDGFKGLRKRYNEILNDPFKPNPSEIILELIDYLENKMETFYKMANKPSQRFEDLLKMHLTMLEEFCAPEHLWANDDGEAAATFIKNLQEDITALTPMLAQDYIEILVKFMKDVTVRPKYGTHPRLMILGQLEARLLHTDRIIMSGLNEGTWPSDKGHDPWMSRPMRKDFGLPSNEKSVGLAAHDFVQGFCAPEVFLTRSERVAGAPTVPSRWLQRMETVFKAKDIKVKDNNSSPYFQYLEVLDQFDELKPVERPGPKPPVHARPKKLSVTRIEKWLQDPYSIYADKILKLKKLEPLEKEWGALEKGNILHKILERFIAENKNTIQNLTHENFMRVAQEECEQSGQENLWNTWKPRLSKISDWFITQETNWRTHYKPLKLETQGEIIIDGLDFTLEARADRVDIDTFSSYAAIDYKSGGQFSEKGMISGKTPQLPLEAIILEKGGFTKEGIKTAPVTSLSYWQVTGGSTPGKLTNLSDTAKITAAKDNALNGLKNLITTFDNKETPYLSVPRVNNMPRFNDYEHLARIKEWASITDQEEAA